MYEDHLKTCSYCQNQKQKGASSLTSKPTIYIKSPAEYSKYKKLTELGSIIKGISYPSLDTGSSYRSPVKTKGASEVTRKPGPIEREVKLKELGKLVRGR